VKIKYVIQIALVLIFFSSSSAIADEGKDESGKGRPSKEAYRQQGDNSSYFHENGYDRLKIPKGHYPPPGECRIWYPERPAGQQPPPGKCDELANRVPPGAWLMHHPADDPEHVRVNVYDEHRSGKIHVTGEFEIGSGSFVRIILNR
jgi:hypothetical protein